MRLHRLPLIAILLVSLLGASSAWAQPSTRPGIGAIPYSQGSQAGTTFRTWAPFASAVRVAGTFNGWSQTATALFPEGNGFWSRDVASVMPGAQYKFVLIAGGSTLWKGDPRGRSVTGSTSNNVVYSPGSYAWSGVPFEMPAWDDLVMMEVHVGTFGLASGQGPPATFAAATTKLDHLKSLGVNAIALMPVNEFPGSISWGYNPTGLYAVEQSYGGPNALKAFIDAAHQRGIAVFLDVIYNHWGPTDLDLWRFDGWSQGPWGGIFFYNDDRAVTPWGDTRPDYGRPEVRDFISDHAMLWLEEFQADGLRFDATKFVRRSNQGDLPDGWSLLREINDRIDEAQPWKISIAEDMDGDPWITRGTGAGGAGFDSQWDSTFVHPIRGALAAVNDSDRDMNAVAAAIGGGYDGDASRRVIYTDSHDEAATGGRMPTAINPGSPTSWWSRKRATLGSAIIMTAPGLPMMLQGQEFLQTGNFNDTQPLAWNQVQSFAGIVSLHRDLISLRRNRLGRSGGLSGDGISIHHLNNAAKVMAFRRFEPGPDPQDVVVILNLSGTTFTSYRIGMPGTGSWRLRFNSDAQVYDPQFANTPATDGQAFAPPYDGYPVSMTVALGPYSCLIYSRPRQGSADVNLDGTVDGIDLAAILGSWGTSDPSADLTDDGVVSGSDLSVLLSNWGAKG